jgi:hypothetical protein
MVDGVVVIRLSARRYACRSCSGPVRLPVMALSVVVLPSSDDEEVFPWNRHISL